MYNADVREKAVQILESGVGHRTLAAQLGIPVATARQWARAYLAGGSDAVLNAGARHRVYDYELKVAAARERVERGKTVREVMIKYQIPSESSIKAWCRAYRDGGAQALRDKPRGRKPKQRQA